MLLLTGFCAPAAVQAADAQTVIALDEETAEGEALIDARFRDRPAATGGDLPAVSAHAA